MSRFYSRKDLKEELESLGVDYYDYYPDENCKEDTKDEPYWEYIQGHYNPYGKELYDYVKAHKNIKLSRKPDKAKKELSQLNYKLKCCPMDLDKPTLMCEKSWLRLIVELLLDLPDLL